MGLFNSKDCKEGDSGMKSTFLLFVIIGSFISLQLHAQTKPAQQKKIAVKKVVIRVVEEKKVSTTAPEVTKSAFDKFYERLSIGQFSVLSSPNLEDWDSRYAALSPEFSGGTNRDSYPLNLWNQTNFAYNFGAKMKFNFIPRYTIFLAESPDQPAKERGMIQIEDFLIGFSGGLYSSPDKKFNFWTRPALRLPTSHASRTSYNATFGNLTYQPEWLMTFTYDLTTNLQISLWHIHRFWIYEDRFNNSRHRILTIPGFTYKLSDKTNVQTYFEHFLENNKNFKSINGKDPHYVDMWQNLMVGVGHDVTPKLNVMPFISTYINDVPYSTQSLWLGAWISYQIK